MLEPVERRGWYPSPLTRRSLAISTNHFIGLNYEVNLSKPAGERIENVTFQGKPLTDDMTLTLCVNDYRYTG